MDINTVKIVADSSADLMTYEGVPFAVAPLKIITAEREFVDDINLDVDEMAEYLSKYTGKSGSACPAPADWMDAFGDAENIFCATITSNLSGSYNSACIAAEEHINAHPGVRVHVFNSYSAGPEITLIVDKIRDCVLAGMSFDETVETVNAYMQRTGLLFLLQSMQNLANNGRCSHLVAKAAGLLNIRPLGKASDIGTLEMLEKPRGEKASLAATFKMMKTLGYNGGRVYIGHIIFPEGAEKLATLIHAEFPQADVQIYRSRGLCSFYAELGGLMVGFEKAE